jgi:hypothetical protein
VPKTTARELTAGVFEDQPKVEPEEWTTAKVEDELLIEMCEGPIVHHRTERCEINFHELEARMALYDNTKNVIFTVNAIDFTPKLRDELIDAQKNGMLGEIIKNSVFRLLESYHKLAFIERARFRPLNWRIISL